MDDNAIIANNLTKKFNNKIAIENLSFKLPKNTTIFLRGTNGSGKSVTLRMIAGFLKPTKGKIIKNITKIAYTPDHFPENLNLTIDEYMNYISHIYKLNIDTINHYVDMFNLSSQKHLKLRYCSKGTLQKVNVIQALSSDADTYLFDEPLSGLDLDSQKSLTDMIKELQGLKTIVFTSHEIDFASEVCTHVLDINTGILNRKQQVFDSSKSQLKLIVCDYDYHTMDILNNYQSIDNVKTDKSKIYVTVISEKSNEVLKYLIENNKPIVEVKDI